MHVCDTAQVDKCTVTHMPPSVKHRCKCDGCSCRCRLKYRW